MNIIKKKILFVSIAIISLVIILPRLFWVCVNPNNKGNSHFPKIEKIPLPIGNKLGKDMVADIELKYAEILMNQRQPFF